MSTVNILLAIANETDPELKEKMIAEFNEASRLSHEKFMKDFLKISTPTKKSS